MPKGEIRMYGDDGILKLARFEEDHPLHGEIHIREYKHVNGKLFFRVEYEKGHPYCGAVHFRSCFD